ncbi:hypothetical protein [Pontibacter rugosus]|uniref:Uncharacterized protein n=1 Tax=Pontibacter rugosus TaxID=1745966 RepID=A0ABW3SQN3_9BACT
METVGAEFKLPAGLFKQKKVLRLLPDCLEYENKYSKLHFFTKVPKEAIIDIRYGTDWIIWYRFYVGCAYWIELKTQDDKIHKIRFYGYFGETERYRKIYVSIIELLWDYFLDDIVERHLHHFSTTKEIELGRFLLTEAGLASPENNLFINWTDVEVKEYETYYMLFNRQQPHINRATRQGDWETEVLVSVIEAIQQKLA